MLEILCKAIAEVTVETVASVLIQYFNLENVVELLTCSIGLACIVLGAVSVWFGWL